MMELADVSKGYGSLRLFDGLNFTAAASEVTCILGPSGCGKTTLLNLLAGLVHPDSGRVVRPEHLSYVFQEPRLLPWCSVRENAGYAMDHGVSAGERRDRVEGVLEALEILDAAEKLPVDISGGMARRCSLARALLAPFSGILLDEPLASLDPELRNRLLERLPPLLGDAAVVLVTHDYPTALSLADRILRFSEPPVRVTPVDRDNVAGILKQIEEMDAFE